MSESVAEKIQNELDELPNDKRCREKEFAIIQKHADQLQAKLDYAEKHVEYLERNYRKIKSYYDDEIEQRDRMEDELTEAKSRIIELEPQGYGNKLLQDTKEK